MSPNRRDFIKTTAMVGAAVAMVGPDAFASGKLSAAEIRKAVQTLEAQKRSAIVQAPDWIDFQYVVKGPFRSPTGDYTTSVGWKAKWHNGTQYGDFVTLGDPSPLDDILAEVKPLLRLQADDVRHVLLKSEGWPCPEPCVHCLSWEAERRRA